MSAFSSYLANAVLGHAMGKTAIFTLPTAYVALFNATAGQSPRNTPVTVGQTTIPGTPNGHMYRCTTAGTTASSDPGNWSTAQGGTNTDGTAVWTEMFSDFFNNTSNLTSVEANYTGYGRATTSGSTWGTPSSGIINNASAIAFGQCTAVPNTICAAATYDASTAGHLLIYEIASAANGVLAISANVTPSFGVAAYQASLA